MALKFSTRAINLNAGYKPTVSDEDGTQISFTASNTISTTQGNFISKGLRPEMVFKIEGTTNNNGLFTVSSLTSGTITTVEAIVTEAAGSGTVLTMVNGMSWLDIFKNAVMVIYGSPALSDPNDPEGATVLAVITDGGGSFTPGGSTNGLNFTFDSLGKIVIDTSQTWKASAGSANGTAYFAIIYDNGYITGDDSVNLQSPRILGTVGLSGSGADFIVSTTSITTSAPVSVQSGSLTLPAQACS